MIRAILETACHALVAADADGRVVLVNAETEQMFGYARDELLGKSVRVLLPDHPRAWEPTRHPGRPSNSGARGAEHRHEMTGRRKDGTEFAAEVFLKSIETEGDALAVSFVTDITERRQAAEALQRQRYELGERVKELNCLYGISDLAEKPGLSLDEIIQGVVDLIPPAWQYPEITAARITLQGRAYITANFSETTWKQTGDIVVHRKRAGTLEVCYLKERPDSDEGPFLAEERNLANAIVQRLGKIVERIWAREKLHSSEAALRRSQDKLRGLAGHLISVQEEERGQLARELHDELNQDLMVVALELARIEQQVPCSPDVIRHDLKSVQERVEALSDEVRRVSHRLHPAVLEFLGLATALEAECERFSKLAGIQVDFATHNLPASLPRDISLCLYRVAQEGLRNVVRHAHSPRVTVSLGCAGDGIRLSVQDFGEGFEPELVNGRSGLGLVCMEERLRLVNGSLSVKSRPGEGTHVEALAPLSGEPA